MSQTTSRTSRTGASSPSRTRISRTRQWGAVVGATAAALAVWAVSVPIAGLDLTVGSGPSAQTVGPVAVAGVSLLAGAAAWGLLAFLERRYLNGRRGWRITAWCVLALSLLGPVGMGGDGGTLATLITMHLVVGSALIYGLARPTTEAGSDHRGRQ